MYTNFVVEKADHIATITLHRPEKRNPINEEMLRELEAILHDLRDDSESRVVLITGTENAFCAGADLTIVKGVTDVAERQRIFARARNRRARLERSELVVQKRPAEVSARRPKILLAGIRQIAVGDKVPIIGPRPRGGGDHEQRRIGLPHPIQDGAHVDLHPREQERQDGESQRERHHRRPR